MESQPTPRITAPYLDSYQGRNVMVIGRVVQLRGDQAFVDADGTITAHLNRVRVRRSLLSPTPSCQYIPYACTWDTDDDGNDDDDDSC